MSQNLTLFGVDMGTIAPGFKPPMTTHFQFVLEAREPGKRTWTDTPHSTSHWPSVPAMLENATKQNPAREFIIVGTLQSVGENGEKISRKRSDVCAANPS